jgi:hypothetical protein
VAWRYSTLLLLFLTACTSYPPILAPARGQTAAQQGADAKDFDHQVHSAARSMVAGVFTAWSTEERDKYVACMQGKGYTPAK